MGVFLRKYNTATVTGTHVGLPMIKAGSNDFATDSDWTPAAGDVKVSINSGTEANITTLPAYTNGWWIFQFSGAETTGKSIRVKVVDSATKAVEDQSFIIETFGNASAMYPLDLSDGVRLGLTALPNAVAAASGGLLTFGTGTGQLNVSGGIAESDVVQVLGIAADPEPDVILGRGTVNTGTNSTSFTALISGSTLSSVTGAYNGMKLNFQSGLRSTEGRFISTYVVSSGTATFTFAAGQAFTGTPGTGDTFVIG